MITVIDPNCKKAKWTYEANDSEWLDNFFCKMGLSIMGFVFVAVLITTVFDLKSLAPFIMIFCVLCMLGILTIMTKLPKKMLMRYMKKQIDAYKESGVIVELPELAVKLFQNALSTFGLTQVKAQDSLTNYYYLLLRLDIHFRELANPLTTRRQQNLLLGFIYREFLLKAEEIAEQHKISVEIEREVAESEYRMHDEYINSLLN